ncbi:MAG: PhoPQ-activated pathogenicity-related family protein [Chthonomonadales bacterium]
MLRTWRRPAAACVLLALAALPALADLDAFIKRPEPAYRWELRGKQTANEVTVYDLHMVSQVWQGITWEHRLQIFRPNTPKHPGFCALYNTGGSGSPMDTMLGMELAHDSGDTFAILYNIPNQPLYGGKVEDELVAYTWLKYLETGDDTWPLHFPMAKAVIKAIDTIQALAKEQQLPPIDGFLVCGASKRGWTTWLAGATRDPRIKAIAPMVIDTLNVAAQIPHQLKAFGKPSEQIADYSSTGLLNMINTEAGKRLMQLEDPYSYRDRLTLPKLIILGTNDRYWAQDALNLYWDGLKGPKWVLYTPNSGHGLEDRARVLATLSAFIDTIASGKLFPRMRWEHKLSPAGDDLTVTSTPAAIEGRLWHNHAATQDLRDARWTYEPMTRTKNGFTAHFDRPKEGYSAVFAELVYNLNGHTFTLSTQLQVLGPEASEEH